MNLINYFLNNTGKSIHKWINYFPVYEKNFSSFKDKPITLLEIGVDNGGSLEMWKQYFHPESKIIGIDILQDCKKHEQVDKNIFVRIGDQSDKKFLESILSEFENIDIVIDDGSHKSDHIKASFDFLYPKISKNGCYLIEDLHMVYHSDYGNSLNNSNSFINFAKSTVDFLTADHANCPLSESSFTRDTFSISFYDSIIVFNKLEVPINRALRIPNV